MIESGKKVIFDYVLTVDGEIVDSSLRRGPLEYIHGEGRIIKGLERQLEGLQVGDKRNIIVSPEEGFGTIDPKAFKEVPKTMLSEEITPQVGQRLVLQNQSGNSFPVVIAKVLDDTIVLNLNHPFAGQKLYFEVTIVDIQ